MEPLSDAQNQRTACGPEGTVPEAVNASGLPIVAWYATILRAGKTGYAVGLISPRRDSPWKLRSNK